VVVGLNHKKVHLRDCEDCEEDDARVDEVDQHVTLLGPLTDEQRDRLMQIAHRCPVHKTLDLGVRIRTEGVRP
jgi:putative redox protein